MAADLVLTLYRCLPCRDFDTVDEAQFARNLVRVQRKFELMDQLGCETLLVCSSPLPTASHDDGQLTEQFGALAELASEHGKKVAYEALAWGAHVNTRSEEHTSEIQSLMRIYYAVFCLKKKTSTSEQN